MKVVYKKSIVEKFEDAIIEAKKLNKEIDHIVLTTSEYMQLQHYVHTMSSLYFDDGFKMEVISYSFMGVKFLVGEDSDDSVDELEKGLDLEQLAKKHNFVVVGCGCCGSPLLEYTNGTYTYDRQIDWEENEKYD